ncbi:MAG: hypothetical protein KJ667_05465, partial [Alphaproteobacteria bacterium]|nr:hypothetical protein [Alphaproteobacteria bacterium]
MPLITTTPVTNALTVSQQNLAQLKDVFAQRQWKEFNRLAGRLALNTADRSALLHHVVAHPPSAHTGSLARTLGLSVLFESLLLQQSLSTSRARHSALQHSNAAIEASIGVDALLKRFPANDFAAGSLG